MLSCPPSPCVLLWSSGVQLLWKCSYDLCGIKESFFFQISEHSSGLIEPKSMTANSCERVRPIIGNLIGIYLTVLFSFLNG